MPSRPPRPGSPWRPVHRGLLVLTVLGVFVLQAAAKAGQPAPGAAYAVVMAMALAGLATGLGGPRASPRRLAEQFGITVGVTGVFFLALAAALAGTPSAARAMAALQHCCAPQQHGDLGRLAAYVMAVAIWEEFVFRVALLSFLTSKVRTAGRAIVLNAAIFALFHLDHVVAAFLLGLLFCLMVQRYGTVSAAIFLHFLHDFLIGASAALVAVSALPEASTPSLGILVRGAFGTLEVLLLVALLVSATRARRPAAPPSTPG